MSTPFDPGQLEQLSARIDHQLKALQVSGEGAVRGARPSGKTPGQAAPRQWQAIAEAAGEDPETFWQRFKRVARADLCDEGGVLHGQWKKWGDLNNDDVLKSFGPMLVALGFSGGALQILAVSLAVIVIHLGVTSVCAQQPPALPE